MKKRPLKQQEPCSKCNQRHRDVSDDDVGVMVLKEKHGTIYLDATTPDLRRTAALSVLRGRLKAGYWYYDPEDPAASLLPQPALSREEATALPDGSVKAAALLEWSVYDSNVAENEEATLFLTSARVAVTKKCGDLALCLLWQHDDYEYEGLRVEPLCTSYE